MAVAPMWYCMYAMVVGGGGNGGFLRIEDFFPSLFQMGSDMGLILFEFADKERDN